MAHHVVECLGVSGILGLGVAGKERLQTNMGSRWNNDAQAVQYECTYSTILFKYSTLYSTRHYVVKVVCVGRHLT